MSDAPETKKAVPTSVVTVTDDNAFVSFDDYQPSVTLSVFVYWILPVLVITCMSRFFVDPHAATGWGIGEAPDLLQEAREPPKPVAPPTSVPTATTTNTNNPVISPTPIRPKKKAIPLAFNVADKPTSYIEAVQGIQKRRLNWDTTDASTMEGYGDGTGNVAVEAAKDRKKIRLEPPRAQTSPPRGASTDPVRNQILAKIDELRNEHKMDPSNLYKVIDFADALRMYDVQYHDGGTAQQEAIQSYKTAISLATVRREKQVELGEDTKSPNIAEEVMMSYPSRSTEGILCALYTSLGKTYFMSNMFERAVESYTKSLELEPLYLDAMSARGSSRIILGHYEEAAIDFTTVIENDASGRFLDVYTGLSRILQARESVVPSGWGLIVENVTKLIEQLEAQLDNLRNNDVGGRKELIAKTLNRLYHVLFLYHDVKTKDTDAAWKNLSKSYEHKMSVVAPWNAGFEVQKISTTKGIFQRGFWPDGVGSSTAAPIFIIGFVRSGSTLLERVLDAHPKIVGTGENSVFNGRLDEIRNKIVEASLLGDSEALKTVIESLADGVVDEMRDRWERGFSGDRSDDQPAPLRYADKMLTNYYNVGFIHMLFPNALILHVFREPMDTIFSAYKHEFPEGTLDYTSDFPSLAELYKGYRDLIDHWDNVLPGRVTHVCYEDMVHDMPGVAKKIIEATNLEWDDSILDFHKKKHAVNTLSTTQVRKGVYKDGLQAWKRYEKHLGPLMKLVGKRTAYDIDTSLHGYKRPPPPATEEESQDVESSDATEATIPEQIRETKDEL